MKILLVGEYSRLHNSLKEGLLELGHEVMLISTGDYFKDYPADIILKRPYYSGIGRKLMIGLYKLFGIHIASISIKKQFFKNSSLLSGFDVVQLINESPFGIAPNDEIDIISYLKAHNKKLFLLSCGADFKSISYALSDIPTYSLLTEYKNGKVPATHFNFALKYVTKPFEKLHHFAFENCNGVIASDMDYHLPLVGNPKYLGLISNPVNLNKLSFSEVPIDGKIKIFMGVNRANYHTKGIVYFEQALETLHKKYPNKIEVTVAENLPYSEYIKIYDQAHIIFDQALSFDQGYNALEAMAKGKVVFTGAENEFLKTYHLKEDQVCINATPNAESIVTKASYLIENPEKIIEMGRNARLFVEKEHDYTDIAKKYLLVWKGSPI